MEFTEHHALHPLRVGEGDGLRDHAAHRVAHEHAPPHVEVVQEGEEVRRQLRDRLHARAAALAVSAQVEPDHPAPHGEVGHLVVPAVPVRRPAVYEHQGHAVAVARTLVVVRQGCAVDFELRHACLLRCCPGY